MTSLTPVVRSPFEHLPLVVHPHRDGASRAVAHEIAALIRSRPVGTSPVVLGLATGSTPVALYAELVRLHREEGLSFRNVVTFNLDEYYGLEAEHPQSYRSFMRRHLFDAVDLAPDATHVPDGKIPLAEVDTYCRAYEEQIRAAGGIDLQILGIGRTGHIGFNEPGSSNRSRTRLVTLDPLTRRDASNDFGGEEKTPRRAITMGVRTILEARRVVLMAWGPHKAEIVRSALEGPITPQVTASFLQEHDQAVFVLDGAAAGGLTRERSPWLLGPLEDQGLVWDDRMKRRAILWLAQRTGKALLKLTDDDYNEAGLSDLLAVLGSAYEANRVGFYQMQHTITGWPGGRDPRRTQPGDAPVRPLQSSSAQVFPKRILVLSPHPDDDVISMGGTLCRLVDQGHEVHVAYEVSGANAVSDETLWSRLLFVAQSGLATNERGPELAKALEAFVREGQIAALPDARRWKALIRRHEAMAAARVCGVPAERLHFLDLPFYEAGEARARRLSSADLDGLTGLLQTLQPHLVFAAGDLDDPHGTHRLCLQVLQGALRQCSALPWFAAMELWLYRGAWAEWELDEIDLAVPLSPQEVLRRRQAIFRHETQKDLTLFPGGDRREFWQRTEERSRRLAERYNALGLAEYEAMEAFRRVTPQDFRDQALL